MRFGVFDHVDRSVEDLGQQYADRLRLAEAYDRAGLHALHIAEHHGTPLGLAPSPSVFLAAVAQRTTRLRLGPLVYTLARHDPVRLGGGDLHARGAERRAAGARRRWRHLAHRAADARRRPRRGAGLLASAGRSCCGV